MRAALEMAPPVDGLRSRAVAPGLSICRQADSIRLLVVDDHTLLRQGLVSLIEARSGMQVVGEAGNGRDAVQMAERLRPDVVLMDVAMPLMNGVDATRDIVRRVPGTRVLVLGTPAYEDQLVAILRAGATGFLLKDADADELFRAIQVVHQGNSYFSPAVSSRIVHTLFLAKRSGSPLGEQTLTAREREILDMVAEGHTNQSIARSMCVSVKTVEAHKAHIIGKLGLRGAIDLVKYAVRRQMSNLDA